MKKILPLIKTWQPSSWKSLPIKQSPDWPSNELVEAVKKLESFPPLIPFDEIDSLKKQFKRVSDDKAFILIAGDCAETFSDFNQSLIEKKLQIIFQMSLILGYGLEKPIQKALEHALLGVVPKEKKSTFQKISDSNRRLSAYLKSHPILFGLLLLLVNQGLSAAFSDGGSLDLPPDFPF